MRRSMSCPTAGRVSRAENETSSFVHDLMMVAEPGVAATFIADEAGPRNLLCGVLRRGIGAVEVVAHADDERRRLDCFQGITRWIPCEVRVVDDAADARADRKYLVEYHAGASLFFGTRGAKILRRGGEHHADRRFLCELRNEPVREIRG